MIDLYVRFSFEIVLKFVFVFIFIFVIIINFIFYLNFVCIMVRVYINRRQNTYKNTYKSTHKNANENTKNTYEKTLKTKKYHKKKWGHVGLTIGVNTSGPTVPSLFIFLLTAFSIGSIKESTDPRTAVGNIIQRRQST